MYLLSRVCVGGGYLDSSVPMCGCAQLRPDCSFPLHSDSLNGYMTMRPSAAGNPPFSSSSEKRRSIRKGKQASHSSNISILKYTVGFRPIKNLCPVSSSQVAPMLKQMKRVRCLKRMVCLWTQKTSSASHTKWLKAWSS